MKTTVVSATEVQKNFEKYLQSVQNGEEVIILEDGKEIARIISAAQRISFLTDSLTGVLRHDYDDKAMRAERIASREAAD